VTDVNKYTAYTAAHSLRALTYRPSDYLHDTSHWLPGASSRRKQRASSGVWIL